MVLGAKESDLLLSDELEWWKSADEILKFKVSSATLLHFCGYVILNPSQMAENPQADEIVRQRKTL